MKGKIAVENELTPVKDYLSGKGYSVDCIDFHNQSPAKLKNYDAIVVTGLNSDYLGNQATKTSAVVINADGMTPEDIAKELECSHKSFQ
jgi:Uncharacterised protein family (UPF0180).